MEIVTTGAALRQAQQQLRTNGRSYGVVPTMGALHIGHLSLIERARRENELVGVSVFVNPTQFGPQEDYQSYPRQFENDCQRCEQAGVDIIFAPETAEVYRENADTEVDIGALGTRLEGACRPGHFRGVATIVSKLFNYFLPTRAYFGEKDAQQLAVIKQLVRDLNFPVTIVPCPTYREADGLACSSRNKYLTPQERQQATSLYATLQEIRDMILSGVPVTKVESHGAEQLAAGGFGRIDYITVVDRDTFLPPGHNRNRLVCAAAYMGSTRLIDNLIID